MFNYADRSLYHEHSLMDVICSLKRCEKDTRDGSGKWIRSYVEGENMIGELDSRS